MAMVKADEPFAFRDKGFSFFGIVERDIAPGAGNEVKGFGEEPFTQPEMLEQFFFEAVGRAHAADDGDKGAERCDEDHLDVGDGGQAVGWAAVAHEGDWDERGINDLQNERGIVEDVCVDHFFVVAFNRGDDATHDVGVDADALFGAHFKKLQLDFTEFAFSVMIIPNREGYHEHWKKKDKHE